MPQCAASRAASSCDGRGELATSSARSGDRSTRNRRTGMRLGVVGVGAAAAGVAVGVGSSCGGCGDAVSDAGRGCSGAASGSVVAAGLTVRFGVSCGAAAVGTSVLARGLCGGGGVVRPVAVIIGANSDSTDCARVACPLSLWQRQPCCVYSVRTKVAVVPRAKRTRVERQRARLLDPSFLASLAQSQTFCHG